MSSAEEGGPAAVPAAAEPPAEAAQPDGGSPRGRSVSPSLRVRTSSSPPRPKYKRRKVALFLMYLGHEYSGMQHNPDVTTIESELFEAIRKAGGISEANAEGKRFQKVHWDRAARTDRGVSAVGQVVSLQMIIEPEGIIERINGFLPPDIRALGFFRTTSGFDSRKMCDRRRYEYVLPAWMFFPGEEAKIKALLKRETGQNNAGKKEEGEEKEARGLETAPTSESSGQEQARATSESSGQEQARATSESSDTSQVLGTAGSSAPPTFRVFTPADAERMTRILSAYQGTHSFHNFTPAVTVDSPAAQRFIRSFVCEGAFDIGQEGEKPEPLGERSAEEEGSSPPAPPPGTAPPASPAPSSPAPAARPASPSGYPTQWVKLSVVGQSFMLHQIRIMVGLALAVFRGEAPERAVRVALASRAGVKPPMAPALGLYLDKTYFDSYNARFAHLHAPIDVDAFDAQTAAFKARTLHPTLARIDREAGVNAAWLDRLPEALAKIGEWPSEERVAEENRAERERKRAQKEGKRARDEAETKGEKKNEKGENGGGRGNPGEKEPKGPGELQAPGGEDAGARNAREEAEAKTPEAEERAAGAGEGQGRGASQGGAAGGDGGPDEAPTRAAAVPLDSPASASASPPQRAAPTQSLQPVDRKRPAEGGGRRGGRGQGGGWGRGRGGGARAERRKRVRKNVPYADELSD